MEKQHVFDNPKNVKRLIRIFFVTCVVILGLDFVVHRHPSFAEGTFAVEELFGFYAAYGFVACVLLVLAAKQMRRVLMRSEDYYAGKQADG
jgi:protein-S-isoprenylcysteine O-methyltransferase Ste14